MLISIEDAHFILVHIVMLGEISITKRMVCYQHPSPHLSPSMTYLSLPIDKWGILFQIPTKDSVKIPITIVQSIYI